MIYENLYEDFKRAVPESEEFCKEHEYDCIEGLQYPLFEEVVRPYMEMVVEKGDEAFVTKMFNFFEEMASCGIEKIETLLGVAILEAFICDGTVGKYKPYMGKKTLEMCEDMERWVYK